MQYLKYIILSLFFFNLPSFTLLGIVNAPLASILSYLSFFLLIFYYIFNPKFKLALPLILVGLFYYLFSLIQTHVSLNIYLLEAVKFFIIVICGNEFIKRCKTIEIFIFLLIGALTVLIQPVFFSSEYGRASGIYLNPNAAGFVCIVGYCFTYEIEQKRLKILGQIIFTFIGLLTFSRTFVLLWLLVNVISLWISVKNIRVFFIGFLAVTAVFSFSQLLGLTSIRLDQLQDIVNNKSKLSEISEDSRTQTWAQYYSYIKDNPIFGNGLGTLRSDEEKDKQGVHNSYLLVWGEAGFVPFLVFSVFFISLSYNSFKYFKKKPYLVFLSLTIALYLLTNHNFFNDYIILFFTAFTYNQLVFEQSREKLHKTQNLSLTEA